MRTNASGSRRVFPAFCLLAVVLAACPCCAEQTACNEAVFMRDCPIGVFDSGIGGLSVLERILALDEFDNGTGAPGTDGLPDFAGEEFVYFGDQANMPYGRYDAAGKADFLRELVRRDARFLLGSDGHRPAKVIVIACNTATAYGLDAVLAMPRSRGEKVIGVVNAGVEAALDAISSATGACAVAVMATPATISSGVYQRTLAETVRVRALAFPVAVASRGGIGLAEAVENAEPGRFLCARTNVVALVADYRARGGTAPIRAFILGCTHYPFVLETIRSTLDDLRENPEYASLLPRDIVFVDPAVYTAISCYKALREDGLLKPSGTARSRPRVNAFMSVGRDGPLADSVKYGRNVTDVDYGTKIVPLARGSLTDATAESVATSFPLSAAALGISPTRSCGKDK
ncbi:MAG: aspartate/glutamate racemase family protein [Kiritimatiellae bacterium]|nr:aspartate/glutamate racemase family protein [Kiritimatiellia bacterium]